VLLRHGQTPWNVEHRFQGHSDIDLDVRGIEQAHLAAQALIHFDPALVVSSDLRRAAGTGAPLASAAELSLRTDARLRETDGGNWEGKLIADLQDIDPVAWHAWRSGADIPAGQVGESRGEVGTRTAAAITEYADRLEDDQTLVVVTHGGAANAAIGKLLGWPVEQWVSLGGLLNGHWAILKAWTPASRQDSSGPQSAWRLAAYGVGPKAVAEQIRD